MRSLASRPQIASARSTLGLGQGWIANLISARGVGPALPALVYLVVFLVIPLGFLFSFAFLTVERSVVVPGSLSLSHFADALSDDLFWKIAWRSFWVGAASTFLCLLLRRESDVAS